MAAVPDLYGKACKHLARKDRVMKRLIERVGACTLEAGGDPFVVLVRSVVAQLISTRAAQTIFGRVQTALGDAGITPQAILALEEDRLRGCGLSGAKTLTIRALATRFVEGGEQGLHQLENLPDEEITARLLPLRGVGPWTVQMFLIFGLGRLNVLPVGDMGVRAAVREHYGLEELPTVEQLRKMAEPWLPYCTIASWYLWRSRGWVPQSK